MAGPGAVIRIDGFEGGALPAKAQIRSIRISRDQFAAEFHSAGGVSIEIITQPGIGPIRYFTNFRVRDDALTGTSPFVASRGPERNTNFGGGLNGTLIKDKSSFGLFVFGVNSTTRRTSTRSCPTGTSRRVAEAEDAARQPVRERPDGLRGHARPDAALRLQPHALHEREPRRRRLRRAGARVLEREQHAQHPRAALRPARTARVLAFAAADVHRRHRLGVGDRRRRRFASTTSSPAAARSSPAANIRSASTSRPIWITCADASRGAPASCSTAAGIDSDASANYLGTYTFDNLDAYLANRPSNYTRRIGDPNLSFRNVQFGVYIQDDIRPRKNLTLSPASDTKRSRTSAAPPTSVRASA